MATFYSILNSCHGVIEHSTVLGAEFSNRTHQLFEKYYPIEINPEISKEEKTPMMIEWWSSAHDLMMEYGLKKHHIKEMFVGANIDVRYLLHHSFPASLQVCLSCSLESLL